MQLDSERRNHQAAARVAQQCGGRMRSERVHAIGTSSVVAQASPPAVWATRGPVIALRDKRV